MKLAGQRKAASGVYQMLRGGLFCRSKLDWPRFLQECWSNFQWEWKGLVKLPVGEGGMGIGETFCGIRQGWSNLLWEQVGLLKLEGLANVLWEQIQLVRLFVGVDMIGQTFPRCGWG